MPGGRPLSLNRAHHYDTDDDGNRRKVTIADVILHRIRQGAYIEQAAAEAGLHRSTLHDYLKRGARARQAYDAGAVTLKAMRRNDRTCMEFADAVRQAQAEAEGRDLDALDDLAMGRHKIKRTTRKVRVTDTGEELVEETTVEEPVLPDAKVLMWRMERRRPARWGHQGSLQLLEPEDELPGSDDDLDSLLDRLERTEAAS